MVEDWIRLDGSYERLMEGGTFSNVRSWVSAEQTQLVVRYETRPATPEELERRVALLAGELVDRVSAKAYYRGISYAPSGAYPEG